MEENKDVRNGGDIPVNESKNTEQKPQIEIVKRDDDLEKFLADIKKDEESEERLFASNNYFERKKPRFIDVENISDSFTYGERRDFKRSDEIDWSEVTKLNKENEKAGASGNIDTEDRLEKNIEFLEKKFSKKEEPAPVVEKVDDEEAKKKEKFNQIKRELRESVGEIKPAKSEVKLTVDGDDEDDIDIDSLLDGSLFDEFSDLGVSKKTTSKSAAKSKKSAQNKKASAAEKKPGTPRVKGVRKNRSKTAGLELPKTGSVIYIDLADIKPVSWQEVVMRKGRFAYHMTPTNSGGWFIKRAGNEGPSAYVADRAEAVELAKKYAKKEKSTLKVHNARGTIVESYSFGHTTKK